MKFNYKFSNLLGSVYHKGNIVFTQDSETLLSPVGNRVTLYDLKRCASQTLSVESKFNITGLALSPNGRLLILINEHGEAMLISTMKMTVLYKHRFNRAINCVRFSPDGRYFAVTKENLVFVYLTPGKANKMYNPFTLYRVLQGAYDETTTLTWSSDSRVLAVGSKDMSTRIHPLDVETGRRVSVLGGHNAAIVSVFLMHETLDCYTLSSNGQVCVWTCSHTLEEMKDLHPRNKSSTQSTEESELRQQLATDNTAESADTPDDNVSGVRYKQRLKRYLLDLVRGTENGETGGGGRVELTSCDYHHDNSLLVTGYSNGCFLLHEMPDVTLIHSLSVSDERVSAVAVCPRGDWIAVACSGKGQLLVWEWRSETYVLKQQGHVNNMTCLSYSPNGELVATGAHDGKVKLWNCISGFCFVTFSEHRSSITGVQFTQSGRAVVSASLDGTVRAFDTTRYRNFRTLTSPRPAQFSCLAVDSSGELVAAGAQDLFEIYLWSLQLGKLLEVLSGHQGPVSGIVFSPNPSSSALASTSWDQTLRIWDVISSKVQKETIDLRSEGLSVVYSPDGGQLAVACLSGQIQLFDPVWAAQTGCIEGRSDLHSGRADADQIKAKTKLQAKAFTTLCYTADGRCILAAGHSKNVCIYHVQERLLMAKYEITQNRSLDAVDDFINRRKLCEFGNLSLVESRDDDDASIHVRMPGAKHGDMAARAVRPEIRVLSVQFSPTGDVFGAVSTEGLLVYSLSPALVFEPLQLQEDITRDSVLKASAAGDHSQALLWAFHLNQPAVTRRVIERVPYEQISGMVTGMPHRYVERLLVFLSAELDVSAHVQFYSSWVHQLLQTHTGWMRVRVSRLLPQLRQLQRALSVKHNTLGNICSHNHYMLQYLCNLADLQHEAEVKQEAMQGAEDGTLQDGSLQDTLSPTPKRTIHCQT